MRRAVALAAGLLSLAGCATGGALTASAQSIRADVEKARKAGALRCAPKALAQAEANLDIGLAELDSGHASRAGAHLEQARQGAKKALEQTRSCGPSQVTIRAPKDPAAAPAVVIELVDEDGDGVPDLQDRCPEVAGLPALQGCPDADGDGLLDGEDACPDQAGPREAQGCPPAKDTDGDHVPDDLDRCPLDPEDADGFQDDDGCPDPDNDGDGVVDRMDACPNTPGTFENRGCPAAARPAPAGPAEPGAPSPAKPDDRRTQPHPSTRE